MKDLCQKRKVKVIFRGISNSLKLTLTTDLYATDSSAQVHLHVVQLFSALK